MESIHSPTKLHFLLKEIPFMTFLSRGPRTVRASPLCLTCDSKAFLIFDFVFDFERVAPERVYFIEMLVMCRFSWSRVATRPLLTKELLHFADENDSVTPVPIFDVAKRQTRECTSFAPTETLALCPCLLLHWL